MSTVSRTTPLWIAARQLLEAQGAEFFKCWAKVAKQLEVEEIHDLRVASRRLREGLALFEPCFRSKRLARIGKQVKQVTTTLGNLRNTDEAILFFSQLEPEERQQSNPEVRELLDQLALEGLVARRKLADELDDLKPGPLKSQLSAELAAPQLFNNNRSDPFQEVYRYADGALAARAHPLTELLPGALEEANAGAQHQLRIAVKKLRYRVEILQPLFTSGFPELHRSLKGYQEVLGKLHDLDVFAALVLERVPLGAGQQNLLRDITFRRSRLFADFLKMQDSTPVDAIGARARSYL